MRGADAYRIQTGRLCWAGWICLAALLLSGAARGEVYPTEPYRWGGPGHRGRALTWGDIDNDGDLDVVCGNEGQADCLYFNTAGTFSVTPDWVSASTRDTETIALGDVNGDGYLDLVCGENGGYCRLYLNQGGMFESVSSWRMLMENDIRSVALGDVDGDGDLDLVCATYTGPTVLFLNQGEAAGFFTTPAWQSSRQDHTRGVALGDMDGDGDLDLVCGNYGEANTLWQNAGPDDWFGVSPGWSAEGVYRTCAVALGDVDGDGRLDLISGNLRQAATLHLNSAQGLSPAPSWQSPEPYPETRAVALGDVDTDGDLDLLCGNSDAPNTLFRNDAGGLTVLPVWSSDYTYVTYGVALVDVDGNGSLDAAVVNYNQENNLYSNAARLLLETTPSWLTSGARASGVVALGDVTGDGLLDVVFGDSDLDLSLYVNESGDLATRPRWVRSVDDGIMEVALGDVDGDGRSDLAVAARSAPAELYLGREDTGLGPEPAWSVVPLEPNAYHASAFGDVDRDGDLDLVLSGTGGPALFRNREGALGSEPEWQPTATGTTYWSALGEVNGDGWPDLLESTLSSGHTYLRLYLGSPQGFQATPDVEIPRATVPIKTGDVSGDGLDDALLETALHLGSPSGLDAAPTWAPGTALLFSDAALGDVDADGGLELAVSQYFYKPIVLYANVGAPGILSAEPIWQSQSELSTLGLAFGDVDADGDLDLVCGNGNEEGVPMPSGIHRGVRNPAFRSDPQAPVGHVPNNSAFLRFVRVQRAGPNRLRLSATVFDVERDPVWLRGEYQYEGERTRHPAQLIGAAGRVGPLTSSPGGEVHEFDWDVSAMPFDARKVVLHLSVISHPARAGLVQRIATYQQAVGPVEPQRPQLAVLQESVSFATMTVGDSAAAYVILRNVGNEALTVSRIESPSPALLVDCALPLELAPQDSARVDLLLAPVTETELGGDLVVESNDPLRPSQRIALQTDILPLEIRSRLLTGAGEVPLGEALTAIVTPGYRVNVEGGWFYHRPGATGGAAFDSLPLVPSAGEFIATIPGGEVTEAGLEYFVRVHNGRAVTTDPPGAPADSVFRQGVAQPDRLTSSPKPNSGTGFLEGRPVRVEVTLPVGASLQEGWLHYRPGGAHDQRTLALEPTRDDVWVATIPESLAGPRGVQYWVEARTQTTSLTDPPVAPETAPHAVPITVQDLAESQLSPAGRYRMVSIPLQFGEDFTGTLEALLADQAEFGSYDPVRWRAFRWRTDSEDYAEFGDADATEEFRPLPGRAFWLAAKLANRVSTAPVSGISTPLDDAYALPLAPGWNQIGNPFAFTVPWDSVRADGLTIAEAEARGLLEPPWRWDATLAQYRADVDVLEPFAGYWVRNLSPSALTLWVPPHEAGGGRSLAQAQASCPEGRVDPAGNTWAIQLTARCGALRDEQNWAGVHPRASVRWDPGDRSDPPAAPGPSLNLCFPHGSWQLHPGTYAVDLQPGAAAPDAAGDAQGWVWHFDVSRDGAGVLPDAVELTFGGIEAIPAAARVCLLDRRVQSSVELRENARYAFHCGDGPMAADEEAARFVLLVGGESFVATQAESAWTVPRVTRLHPVVPNPAWSMALLRFEIARSCHVQLELFDARGARIRTLYDGLRQPGRHAVSWDGLDDRGCAIAQGTYFCRLKTGLGEMLTRKLTMIR